MVLINDVWNELWTKSRKMIVRSSFRPKKQSKPAIPEKRSPQSPLPISPQEASINTSQERVNYRKNPKNSQAFTRNFTSASTRHNKVKRTSSRRRASCFNHNAKIYVTVDPATTPSGLKLVKCHLYDTISPQTPDLRSLGSDDLSQISDDECIHLSEEALVHAAPSSTSSILDDISRLIQDENGEYLSPIKSHSLPSISTDSVDYSELVSPSPPPLHKAQEKRDATYEIHEVGKIKTYESCNKNDVPIARRNLEDRFVVNAYRSGCWQRLSKREKGANIDDTQIIKVSERSNIVVGIGDKHISDESNKAKVIADNVGLVGELYRARITPDKILARKLQEKQKRVMPSSLLSMFDDMPAQEVLQAIDKEASKMERNSQAAAIYATPLKTSKKTDVMEEDCFKKEKPRSSSVSCDNETFTKLKEEADYQCKIMRQASKALEVSRRSDSSCDIRPQVEAEKILLTANCKYEKVLQEIRQTHYEKPINPKHTGTIEISSLSFEISPKMTETQTGYFVLVMTDDKRIFTSTPVDIHLGDKILAIDRSFRFDAVDASFEIIGKLYCLLKDHCIRKKTDGRLTNKLRLSGRKLRYTDLYTKDPVENSIVSSSFIPVAQFKVNVNDLHRSSMSSSNGQTTKNRKMMLYENCPLNGSFHMDIKLAQLKMDVEKVGMVNVRSKNNPVSWNRRWCTLAGSALRFWNSPLDEDFKSPMATIDLGYCLHEIENAKREDCPRPKTLAIVTVNETHYLNIDTISELRAWKKPLNDVYRALKDWKLLKID